MNIYSDKVSIPQCKRLISNQSIYVQFLPAKNKTYEAPTGTVEVILWHLVSFKGGSCTYN